MRSGDQHLRWYPQQKKIPKYFYELQLRKHLLYIKYLYELQLLTEAHAQWRSTSALISIYLKSILKYFNELQLKKRIKINILMSSSL